MANLLIPISKREFRIYELSLQPPSVVDTHEFEDGRKSPNGSCVGAILRGSDPTGRRLLILRRQVDARFVVTHDAPIDLDSTVAVTAMENAMRINDPPEAIPPGVRRRPLLLDLEGRTPGSLFELLTRTLDHLPALLTLGEVYLAMPRPDTNFVSDFQTANFESRLWELYLLAAFREQGLAVYQDCPSPDFRIERDGCSVYVEAVTAHSEGERPQPYAVPQLAPARRRERLLGAPAERFAKTIRSKLQRNYQSLPNVADHPFALAIADFHASGSMVWSREALPTYLYGSFPDVVDGPDGRFAVATPVDRLIGQSAIPAGLFRDPTMAFLSAIICSNAATISKFNRMGFLAGWRPQGLSMRREGILFDRTPGAVAGIPFALDILSDAYAALWPPDGEAWCVELEVYHNPLAARPIPFHLLPGATHWFESGGEVLCSTMWEHQVLSSITQLSRTRVPG